MKQLFVLILSLLFLGAFAQSGKNTASGNNFHEVTRELLRINNEDQSIRFKYLDAFNTKSSQKKIDSLASLMKKTDSLNTLKVAEIIDKHGWLGPDEIGNDANFTLFLIVQHAELKVQQKYLLLLRDAVKQGRAAKKDLAYLEDRVALGEGRLQIYGTQVVPNLDEPEKGYVRPMIDPINVDTRRKEVGLEPLDDYIQQWGMKWDVKQYVKDLPELLELERIRN